MATPPWMEGPPLQQQQANVAPQQQQQGPPQASGLSALERMLNNAPKPPGAGPPDPYGQQWGPGPSQGPMSGYQTPTQGGPGGWYQPPGSLPGDYPYGAPGDPNMPPQSFGPPPPQQAPQDQRYPPPDIQQNVGGPPTMSQQDLGGYYSQNANTGIGPSDQWWGYPSDGQGNLGPPAPSPSSRQYDQYPGPPQSYYPTDPQGYGPAQPPHSQAGMYDPNIPSNAFNGGPGGLGSQGANQYAPPPQQFDQFGGGGGYSQAPQHVPPPSGGYFDQGYCETTPYGPVKNEPLPPSPYPTSPSLNRGSVPAPPTGQGPVQGQQQPQMFSPYGGQQGYPPTPTPPQPGLPPPPPQQHQQQYPPMTSAQQRPPPQAGPTPAEGKKPRRRTKKGKEPAPEPAPVPPSALMQPHPSHMGHMAPMPGQYGPPPSPMGAPMRVGLPPEYNPYAQGPPGQPGYPMNPGGPMDTNGPVMGGQCPPGMQPPMHNGSGLGQPHGMGPMGQQLPPQPPLPGQHPMYGGFGPPPDQQLMGPQQSHQHLPPQQQLQPGEQRGVKREGDLMAADPQKRLASVLSQDDNALGHAPVEEGCVKMPLGAAVTGEPGGADNGSTKDDNVTEKDESTQESTNTIESAKTETEDDDPSKMGATNGDRCRGASKKENGESNSGKDGGDAGGGSGGNSKDGNDQGGDKKTAGDQKVDGETKDNDDSVDGDKASKLHLRRNIKDIKDEASLDERTKRAQKEEKERMERLQKQRQKALNALKELRGQLAKSEAVEGQASSDEIGLENKDAKRDDESSKVSADVQDDGEDVTVVKEEKRVKTKEKDREKDGDVIELSSGDEDDASSDVPKDRDVINVSDESEDEDEELDFTTFVHPIRDDEGRVLINVGHDDEEDDIFIAPQLAPIIKPHQIGGVRFLYENVVESKERFETTPGFGCILAHSMGLGKTIQVITFVDVFLRHTSGRKVLVITPINTIQNWQAEFDKWVPKEDQVHPSLVADGHVRPRNYYVFLLNEAYKSTTARHRVIKEWEDKGGVMLMGYEMYRTLALKKTYKPKGRKKANNAQDTEETLRRDRALLEEVYDALVNPGPDLVVCDEGHRIKNCNASTSAALKDIKTRRRIVLTGYPLQNNLIEYWCMVDFVRPAYLGTKMEFTNMFERPIQNGQCVDSTPKDRQLMKFRAHVLHSLLIGFVQRRGHGVLKDALPHKEEHVIMVRMTEVQRALYSALVREFVTDSDNSANPLKIFAVCCKIWNHPDILYNLVRNKKGLPPTAVMDLDIDDGTAEGPSSVLTPRKVPGEDGESLLEPEPLVEEKDEVVVKKKRGRKKKEQPAPPVEALPTANKVDDELNKISYEWAYEILDDYKPDDIANSHKMVLLMEMIDTAMKIGDKLLVFSQSLLTLDLVERFLQARDLPPRPGLPYVDKWVRNRTYFRLDGSTSGQDREKLINDFNHNPCVALFLLSTRAGCLGINLIGANRIIVLDASWNPCHDAQAVCRVYRYGQQKPCYIYRFVCDNSLEKRIYDRQVNKQGMSDRVVDEMNPEAKLTWKDVSTLVHEDETDPPIEDFSDKSDSFSDPIMKQVVAVASTAFTKLPFEHESLLLDQKDQKLTKYEKKLAKISYEQEKKAAQLGGRCNYGGVNMVNGARGAGGTYGTYPQRVSMVRDFKTGQLVPTPMGAIGVNAGTALVHQLIKQGMTVQKMKVPRSLSIGLVNEPPVHVAAGSELFVMKTPRGVYLRLPCERVIAMRLPQTLDQLCMARPSPFRSTTQPEHGFMHTAAARKPEVINLDDDSSTDVEDDKPSKAKPTVITIESETISRNKGLYDMLTKDCKSAAAPKDDTDGDLLGRVAANKDLQLQVTEVRTERKARMKITQRKRVDAYSGSGGSGSGGDRAHLLELNGDGVEVSEVPLEGLDGVEGDVDLEGATLRHAPPDEEMFDLGGLLGTEISVSPVKPPKQRRKSPLRTKLDVDDDDDDDDGLDDSLGINGQANMPSSNDNSQGSASDNSVGVKRNPLTIQSLDEMLGAPKTTNPALPLLTTQTAHPIPITTPPPTLELVEPDTTTT